MASKQEIKEVIEEILEERQENEDTLNANEFSKKELYIELSELKSEIQELRGDLREQKQYTRNHDDLRNQVNKNTKRLATIEQRDETRRNEGATKREKILIIISIAAIAGNIASGLLSNL